MKKKGFTLIEVLLSSSIAAVVGVLLLGIIINNTGLFYQQSSRVNQGLDSNDALLSIRSSIKESSVVSVGYPELTPTYTTGVSVLVLKLPAFNASNQVIANVFDYAVFVVESGKLKIKVFPSVAPASSRKPQNTILAENVESIIFKYYNLAGAEVSAVDAVRVKTTLKLNQKAGSKNETSIATAEAILRND